MKKTFTLLFLLICFSTASSAAEDNSQRDETYKNLEVFSNVLTLLQEHYVDAIDPEEVITGAINGMLSSLDPHSSYLEPDDFKELQEDTQGSFSGIGIEITIRDGILTVVSPIEGTPAYHAGIEAGDQIIRIEDELTKNMTIMDAVKRMRGKKGTKITISVFRKGWQELKDFTLVRAEIPVHSVKSMELEPGLLYVRISNFQSNTTRDFRDALNNSGEETPVEGLILDLRNNPGGLLDQAVKVTDIFLEKGVIVSTRGRNKEQDMVFEAQADDWQYHFPLIVLVNGGSASASEIVAGALQDHKKAIVLGTETFGKGSVQTIVPMSGGAGLRLTTARYYTPSGDSIQATGIQPDITVEFIPPAPDMSKQKNDHQLIREKDLPRHIKNDAHAPGEKVEAEEEGRKDTGKFSEATERLQKDNQLRTALFILKSLRIAEKSKEKTED
jgi:carboxyl-terminal processing protease